MKKCFKKNLHYKEVDLIYTHGLFNNTGFFD